ncbi:hypothetical protein ACQHIV_13045 [Kribbella sp. GL6]|uniref:hypothetical protein n=1 Tax=Kribbella sp. GL6 TaxID=3419765 RepID=UPI003CFC8434
MPESNELASQVQAMRIELEDVSQMTEALLRSSGAELEARILDFLQRDDVATRIFELTDGVRSQLEISRLLKADGLNSDKSKVSRTIELLRDEHRLLIKSRSKGGSAVYRHSKLTKALHIDRTIARRRKRS